MNTLMHWLRNILKLNTKQVETKEFIGKVIDFTPGIHISNFNHQNKTFTLYQRYHPHADYTLVPDYPQYLDITDDVCYVWIASGDHKENWHNTLKNNLVWTPEKENSIGSLKIFIKQDSELSPRELYLSEFNIDAELDCEVLFALFHLANVHQGCNQFRMRVSLSAQEKLKEVPISTDNNVCNNEGLLNTESFLYSFDPNEVYDALAISEYST